VQTATLPLLELLLLLLLLCRGEAGVAARTYLGVTIKVQDGLWLTATPRA
jgi:hypothetical protein